MCLMMRRTSGRRFVVCLPTENTYHSDTSTWFKPGRVRGLDSSPCDSTSFVSPVKKGSLALLTQGSWLTKRPVAEHPFDFLLLDGLEAFITAPPKLLPPPPAAFGPTVNQLPNGRYR